MGSGPSCRPSTAGGSRSPPGARPGGRRTRRGAGLREDAGAVRHGRSPPSRRSSSCSPTWPPADRGVASAHLRVGAAEGRRPAVRARGRHGEALRQRDGDVRHRPGHPDPRRLRLHQGLPGRALLPRREALHDRRGHQRDPAHGHRARPAEPHRRPTAADEGDPTERQAGHRRSGAHPDRPLPGRAGRAAGAAVWAPSPCAQCSRAAGSSPQRSTRSSWATSCRRGSARTPRARRPSTAACPPSVSAMTINKVCGSGLKAVALAAQAISAGDASCIVAGGMENMSRIPYALLDARDGLAPRPRADHRPAGPRRPVGRLQRLPHGDDRGAGGREVRHHARGSRTPTRSKSQRRAVAARDAGEFEREIVAGRGAAAQGRPVQGGARTRARAPTLARGAGQAEAGVQARRRHGDGRQRLHHQRRRRPRSWS